MDNWLIKRAQLTPDRLAVHYQDTRLTFAQMKDRVLKLASQLAVYTQNQERVAVVTSNNLQGYLKYHLLTLD